MYTQSDRKLAVTIREAVEMSGIGRSSLYKLFWKGVIVPRKSGKRTLILVSDLERLIAELPPAQLAFHSKKIRSG